MSVLLLVLSTSLNWEQLSYVTNFHPHRIKTNDNSGCLASCLAFTFQPNKGNFWQPKFAIWRPITLLGSPVCSISKNLSSGPTITSSRPEQKRITRRWLKGDHWLHPRSHLTSQLQILCSKVKFSFLNRCINVRERRKTAVFQSAIFLPKYHYHYLINRFIIKFWRQKRAQGLKEHMTWTQFFASKESIN